jgi:hypothetical protein
MAIKQQLETVLASEMDRKNFLKYGSGLIVAAVGATGVVAAILRATQHSSLTIEQSSATKSVATGYGASAYGA